MQSETRHNKMVLQLIAMVKGLKATVRALIADVQALKDLDNQRQRQYEQLRDKFNFLEIEVQNQVRDRELRYPQSNWDEEQYDDSISPPRKESKKHATQIEPRSPSL